MDGRIRLLQAWLDQGFELGNHTYSHPSLNKVGLAAFSEDLLRGETITRLLLEPLGQKLRWFRHPFLDAGATAEDKAGLEQLLAARGYRIAPVTVDAWDWYFTYRYAVAKRRGDAALAERSPRPISPSARPSSTTPRRSRSGSSAATSAMSSSCTRTSSPPSISIAWPGS